MIRVNLARSSGEVRSNKPNLGFASDNPDLEAAKKLVIICAIAALLFAYESYNIGQLKKENNKISNQALVLQTEVAAKRAKSEEAKKLQAELEKMESKISIVKGLSKHRLRELKAFDTLQAILPEKVWIEQLNYVSQKMNINGLALDDEDLSLFLKAMQERPNFSKVILKRAQDRKVKDGVLKEFFIEANVESVE